MSLRIVGDEHISKHHTSRNLWSCLLPLNATHTTMQFNYLFCALDSYFLPSTQTMLINILSWFLEVHQTCLSFQSCVTSVRKVSHWSLGMFQQLSSLLLTLLAFFPILTYHSHGYTSAPCLSILAPLGLGSYLYIDVFLENGYFTTSSLFLNL